MISRYNIWLKISSVFRCAIIIVVLLSIYGCANVPVEMSSVNSNFTVKSNIFDEKIDKKVVLVIPDKFKDFSIKSIHKNMNMTYVFEANIGMDMYTIINGILNEKFNSVKVVKSESNATEDIVVIPDVYKSRISTRKSNGPAQEPYYAIEINLNVIEKINGNIVLDKTIRAAAEHKTEINDWFSTGADALDQKKIQKEYRELLNEISDKLIPVINSIEF